MRILGLLAALLLATCSPAQADFIDPATLQIGGTVPPVGGDPNLIGSNGIVNVYQNQGGSTTLDTPWLLIVGIANRGPGAFIGASAIESVTSTNPFPGGAVTAGSGILGGSNLYGGTWNTATGFAGSMTAGGEVYSTIGLQGPTDNSNSFVNWAAADLAINGITATSFGIYVFEIDAVLGAKGVTAIQFGEDVAKGTFAIAYGQEPQGANVQIFDTPFTQSGLTTGDFVINPTGNPPTVPGPGALSLAIAGLAAIGLRRRLMLALA